MLARRLGPFLAPQRLQVIRALASQVIGLTACHVHYTDGDQVFMRDSRFGRQPAYLLQAAHPLGTGLASLDNEDLLQLFD
jgi:hypothetical protein